MDKETSAAEREVTPQPEHHHWKSGCVSLAAEARLIIVIRHCHCSTIESTVLVTDKEKPDDEAEVG